MWLINLIASVVVLAAAWSLARWCTSFSRRWAERRQESDHINPTMRLILQRAIQAVIYIIALLTIGQIWHIDIGPLWAGLGVAGVAIALGLQETLSNLFAAVFVIIDKTIRVGAYLRMDDGTVAKVEDISWRSTRLRTAAGEKIIMPNRLFANQKVVSYGHSEKGWRLSLSAIAGPSSKLADIEAGAIAAAKTVAGKYQKVATEPQFYFEELTATGLKFRVIIKIDQASEEIMARHELLKNIINELAERSCPLVGR